MKSRLWNIPCLLLGLLTNTALFAQTSRQSIPFGDQSLRPIGATLYADPAYDPRKYAELSTSMRKAKQSVTNFFGEQRAPDPDVIFCKRQACASYFSGSSQRGKALRPGQTGSGGAYKAQRPTIVIVKQGPYAQAQLAHEMNHIEVNARTAGKVMPSWFVEGLATLMAGQPDCSHNERIAKDGTNHLRVMQTTNASWATYTDDPSRSRTSYCQASYEVSLWITRHGKPALISLLDQVRMGKHFDDLYGPMLSGSLTAHS